MRCKQNAYVFAVIARLSEMKKTTIGLAVWVAQLIFMLTALNITGG